MRRSVVIFDLDGTLLDTGKGIRNSVRYVERQMGLSPLNDDALNRFIGPAPGDSYMRYHSLSEEMSKTAVHLHREYAEMQGIYEASAYEGIETVLQWLKKRKTMLAVATLKREDLALKILEHFRFLKYFNEVCGMDVQEKLTKIDLIKSVLQKTNNIAERAIMVGDTEKDKNAAKACGVKFVGVTYGYGYNTNSQHPFLAGDSNQLRACLERVLND